MIRDINYLRSIFLPAFQNYPWQAERKSKRSCRGNIDTFFGHLKSVQPYNVQAGHATEDGIKALICDSVQVQESSIAGTMVNIGVGKSNTSISGNKQVDQAFFITITNEISIDERWLFVLEQKSSADMDNKAWPSVLEGISSVAEEVARLAQHPLNFTKSIILCPNDITNHTPKHRYANSLISSIMKTHNLVVEPQIKGWDWLFNLVGIVITPHQYYQTLAQLGKMITKDIQWGDWNTQVEFEIPEYESHIDQDPTTSTAREIFALYQPSRKEVIRHFVKALNVSKVKAGTLYQKFKKELTTQISDVIVET